MKKYFGGAMGAYVGIMGILFIVGPLIFGVVILTTGIDFYSIIIALFCVAAPIFMIIVIRQTRLYLLCYSWGTFDENGVHVKSLFSKNFEIEYAKCKSIGIGLYVHGVLNSDLGSKEKYIFFSYGGFREQFRLNINQWQPNETRIKVKYSKKLYNYLLTVLPEEQANVLKNDYETYVKPFSKK